MGTEPDVPPGTSTSARSPHWDPQGAAGLWDLVNYEPRLRFRGKCVWLAATRPTVSKQKRSLAPGRGPKSELFSAELAGGCGGRPEKRARIVPVLRPPPSALHPGSSTLKQTRWGLSSRGTQLTVCVPAGGRGGAPAVPAVPGRCPFALSQGGRRMATRASEHHKATYCAPGTTDQETRQSRPSGARPRRQEVSSTAGPQHPTPQAFTRHLLCAGI